MTVRVVSKEPVKPRRVVCRKCGYELEFTSADVETSTYVAMGETCTDSYIVCPREACKEHVGVSAW